jgi:hypothetical protein
MPKLSLTIRSASRDNFLATQGIPSFFEAVMWCMHEQTFTDFEFIYVDTYYDQNRARFATINPGFQVKHVPVHKDHRYWYDQGWAFMAAATNTAILYADGELIVSLDDAEFFNRDLLRRYWTAYQCDMFMHASHRRLRSIDLDNGWPTLPISGDVYINDSRLNRLKGDRTKMHREGSWLYAGKSFSLEDALTLNGFNERLDGNSTLEDAEFGVRLAKLGRKFLYDADGCVFILDHKSYVDDPDGKQISRGFIAVENKGYICCAQETDYRVANRDPLTPKQLAIINRETRKYRKFDMYCPENAERLRIWAATPTFDLRQQRAELRASPEWRWP